MIESKICLYPFTRMEIDNSKFTPCCKYWLSNDFHTLDRTGDGDAWNSPAAQELREKILSGDYSLCRQDVCNIPLLTLSEIIKNGSNISECPISPEVIQSLEKGRAKLEHGLTSLSIVVDRRCNLACPSCRDEKILTLSPIEKQQAYNCLHLLKNHRNSLQALKMAGYGEVFFSPWLRKILKIMHPKNFPQLKELTIITNGLLCTPEMYKRLSPGSDCITEISVSIDAGNATTYSIVRGGDWNRLQNNLLFISDLKKNGRIKRFIITFVMRVANIESAEDFVKLGERLDCDWIYFISFSNWKGLKKINYLEEAIHLPSHPKHNSFLTFFNKYKNHPKILMGIQPGDIC